MARLLFLPDDCTIIVLDMQGENEELVAQVNRGDWQPPAPYDSWAAAGGLKLCAAIFGAVVIVTTSGIPAETLSGEARQGMQLSRRQWEVLQGVAEGLTNSQIAARLGVDRRTVTHHVTMLKMKLGAQTRAQTVGRATMLGWVRMKKKPPQAK